MRVQDIMNRQVETISIRDTAVLANELMWRKRIHHLVVMDDSKVVGVISDRDLGGSEADTIPDHLGVKDIVSRDVVTAEPTTTVERALHIFRERRISCLPVLEGERLVGIVTTTDIDNLASRGVSNRPVEGTDVKGPYPPLSHLRGENRA